LTFTEANTVESHLRDLLAGAASARPAQPAIGLARIGGRIAGIGWPYVAPVERGFLGLRLKLIVSRGRQ
jgi:type I restriction enzyme R subunit